jgi:hyperosmotically inducible periplasmic protein
MDAGLQFITLFRKEEPMTRAFSVLGTAMLIVGCAQTDAGITTSVKTQLAADDVVKARNLNVDTADHVVTLRGVVMSDAEETRALEIARATTGVTSVVDEIEVTPEPAAPTTGIFEQPGQPAASDAGLTTAVKAKLLADATVKGLAVDVDTRNQVVTLTGTVSTQAERSRAVELATQTAGVTQVIDRITVGVP